MKTLVIYVLCIAIMAAAILSLIDLYNQTIKRK